MKLIALLLIVTIYYSAVLCEEYTNKYDDIDIDKILSNDRLFNNYANCILEKGKCTPESEELKGHIKEALDTGCAKCSEKHKAGVKKVITYLAKNKPEIWKEAQAKYDPNGTYRNKYADLLKEEGIN